MQELDIEALVDNLDEVLLFVDSQLEKTDCSPKIQMQIELAVEEIFVNIANYAYDPEVGPVTVRVEVMPDASAVSITFIDHGVPYDPLAKEDPDITQTAQRDQLGGFGIFLVKNNMEDVRYEYKDGMNILTIIKGLSQ